MLDPHRVRLQAAGPAATDTLVQGLGCSPVLATLLSQRGLTSLEYAQAFLYDEAAQVCADPFLMADLPLGVSLIEAAIRAGEVIFIHGDYDVDGVCSTVVLVEGLRDLGARVEHHVPDRFSEGYGVSLQAVQAAADRGVGLLLTCDCGSSSHQAIELAQSRGMKVVVTDHHHLPPRLPTPEALINPQRQDCGYPFKPLCGTGIAYKLLCGIYQSRGLAWPTHFLDLVAVATIADVMPLLGENRALVRSGLQLLSRLQRPGLQALAQVAGLSEGPWGSFAVGFGLGPRLNAAGRLEHAGLAVQLLLSSSLEDARPRAAYLDKLNQRRRELEASMRRQVEERLEADPGRLDLGVVVESGDEWHQGVVGITASRVVDRYGLPAFIMGRVGDHCKGSARSPENVDLFQAMQRCADVFIKFGGHARAAGFTVAADRVEEMRQRLAQAVAEVRQGPAPYSVDLELDLKSANLDLARELRKLEPLGEGNRMPRFLARRVRLDRVKTMGDGEEHLRCRLVQGEVDRKAVAFRMGAERPQILEKQLYYDVIFELEEEVWEGTCSASLRIQALLEPDPLVLGVFRRQLASESLGSTRWLDGRNVHSRRAYIEALLEQSLLPFVVVHDEAQKSKVQQAIPDVRLQLGTYVDLQPGFADVVLLYPPPHPDGLRHPSLVEAQRIHVLFGGRELRQEMQRQSMLWLDRPRLESIWRSLVRHARQGPLEARHFASIEEDLKTPSLSLRQAVEVFEELQLLERTSDRFVLRSAPGRRLEESRRYQELCRGREQFLKLIDCFDDRHLRLEEQLVRA